jgi:ADP-heptose:LPS heptosyltransferase
LSAPSIGDVLMDLSGRALLKEYDLDVLIQSKASDLLTEDAYFENVYVTPEEARLSHFQRPYDLIIVDSFSPRILRVKNFIAPGTSFVGIWGFLNGFEVHRTIYSFERIKKLIPTHLMRIRVDLRPTLWLDFGSEIVPNKNSALKIGFAIGGEWASRKYDKWGEVIKSLEEVDEIYLLGSANGEEDAELIERDFPRVHNFLGRLTLKETAEIISKLDLFVAADGGLWHIACALGKPSVSLFSGVFIFDSNGKRILRDTKDIDCVGLHDERAVSNIDSQVVVQAIQKQVKKIRHESNKV